MNINFKQFYNEKSFNLYDNRNPTIDGKLQIDF
jgi:hypothetical protein